MSKEQVKRVFFSNCFLSSSSGKKIAYAAIFVALSVVANTFSIFVTPSLSISLNYVVGFFLGTLFGALPGFAIAFIGDILGFLIHPSGIYWLPTGICSGLLAMIPGFVMNNLNFTFKGGVYVKAVISMVLMYLIVTCGLGAYSNYMYVKVIVKNWDYDKTFFVYLVGKIAFASIVSAVNYALAILLIPVMNAMKFLQIKIK